MYNLRLALSEDLTTIMQIISHSQSLLAQRGVDQWQNGYPSSEVIERDIALSQGYILEFEGEVAAYGALIYGIEPTYLSIENGRWLSELNYVTIHRLAVSTSFHGKGIGTQFFLEMEREARAREIFSLRADTHRDNFVMQRLLGRMGFSLCGDIYLSDSSHRFGFEKVIAR